MSSSKPVVPAKRTLSTPLRLTDKKKKKKKQKTTKKTKKTTTTTVDDTLIEEILLYGLRTDVQVAIDLWIDTGGEHLSESYDSSVVSSRKKARDWFNKHTTQADREGIRSIIVNADSLVAEQEEHDSGDEWSEDEEEDEEEEKKKPFPPVNNRRKPEDVIIDGSNQYLTPLALDRLLKKIAETRTRNDIRDHIIGISSSSINELSEMDSGSRKSTKAGLIQWIRKKATTTQHGSRWDRPFLLDFLSDHDLDAYWESPSSSSSSSLISDEEEEKKKPLDRIAKPEEKTDKKKRTTPSSSVIVPSSSSVGLLWVDEPEDQDRVAKPEDVIDAAVFAENYLTPTALNSLLKKIEETQTRDQIMHHISISVVDNDEIPAMDKIDRDGTSSKEELLQWIREKCNTTKHALRWDRAFLLDFLTDEEKATYWNTPSSSPPPPPATIAVTAVVDEKKEKPTLCLRCKETAMDPITGYCKECIGFIGRPTVYQILHTGHPLSDIKTAIGLFCLMNETKYRPRLSDNASELDTTDWLCVHANQTDRFNIMALLSWKKQKEECLPPPRYVLILVRDEDSDLRAYRIDRSHITDLEYLKKQAELRLSDMDRNENDDDCFSVLLTKEFGPRYWESVIYHVTSSYDVVEERIDCIIVFSSWD